MRFVVIISLVFPLSLGNLELIRAEEEHRLIQEQVTGITNQEDGSKKNDDEVEHGTIVFDTDSNLAKRNMETSFSMVLKKPNLYLVSWTMKHMSRPGMAQSGAVWNAGDQPYLYMGIIYAYSRMRNDEAAIAAATGISGGAAFLIPSLFFPVFKEQGPLFSRLINPKLEKIEKIQGEDCYVISGTSTISKKETFWISKTRYLLVKYCRSFEPPEGGIVMPEITDEQVEEAVKDMGLTVTEERKEKMKYMMKMTRDKNKLGKLKGTATQLHVKISSPELSKKDFEFTVPKGTILKYSPLEGFLRGDE